jgi:hypothetical protein
MDMEVTFVPNTKRDKLAKFLRSENFAYKRSFQQAFHVNHVIKIDIFRFYYLSRSKILDYFSKMCYTCSWTAGDTPLRSLLLRRALLPSLNERIMKIE